MSPTTSAPAASDDAHDRATVHVLHGDAATNVLATSEAVATIATTVLARLGAVVPGMGDAYRREVAEYAAMDDREFDRVLATSRDFLARFLQALADGQPTPVPDAAGLAESGRRRQAMGVSLDAAMHAFRIASRVGWTAIADGCLEVAPTVVSDLAARWLEYADRASTAFAEGHTSASSDQLRRLDARRQALLADLLAAPDVATARAVGAGHGLQIARAYVPLVTTVDDVTAQDRLVGLAGSGVIAGRRGDALVVLVPTDARDGHDHLAQVLATSAPVAIGASATAGPPLAAAVADAEVLVSVAGRLGRTGVVDARDVLLHRAVSEDRVLREQVTTDVATPLLDGDTDGVFVETLRAYLASGSIRAVATALHVHPNTVTYRLRRVLELTGLDPRVPAQAAPLVLACAAMDLAGDTSG